MPGANSCKRRLPFLGRNWTRAAQASIAMGNTASSPACPSHDERPLKRRRINDSPNSAAAAAAVPSLGHKLLVADEVSPAKRSLRIQVLQIVHKDSLKARAGDGDPLTERSRPHRTMLETRGRCKIILSYTDKAGVSNVLNCQSQLCTIRTSQNKDGASQAVRIRLPRPFHVPEDSIFIHREEDGIFHWADSYTISVDLEPVGQGEWPPVEPSSMVNGSAQSPRSPASSKNWILTGELSRVFDRSRCMVPLLLKQTHSKSLTTDYLFDIDARWTTGLAQTASASLDGGTPPNVSVTAEGGLLQLNGAHGPTFTNFDVPEHPSARRSTELGSPSKSGIVNGEGDEDRDIDGHEEEDDDQEGSQTPNRSLRARGNKNYNLKLLSDKAQGRERKRRKLRVTDTCAQDDRVVYSLPAETVLLDSWRCITCGADHRSLVQLTTHFEYQHPEYEMIVQRAARGTNIELVHRYDFYDHDGKAGLRVGKPAKAFNLEHLANGELSGANLHLGRNSGNNVRRSRQRLTDNVASSFGPLERSANGERKVLVPRLSQTLYDPVSRLPLKPGTVFEKHKPDDSWLIQWHRDALEDFSDIPPEEREFLTAWDDFMITQRITSEAFLPSSWLEFVRVSADWLVASEPRMTEFGKHLTYLIARNALNDGVIQQAFQIIRAAKDERARSAGGSAPRDPEAKDLSRRNSHAGCQICGLPVSGPRLLICANSECDAPCYHSNCLGGVAKMSIDLPGWVCNPCYESKESYNVYRANFRAQEEQMNGL